MATTGGGSLTKAYQQAQPQVTLPPPPTIAPPPAVQTQSAPTPAQLQAMMEPPAPWQQFVGDPMMTNKAAYALYQYGGSLPAPELPLTQAPYEAAASRLGYLLEKVKSVQDNAYKNKLLMEALPLAKQIGYTMPSQITGASVIRVPGYDAYLSSRMNQQPTNAYSQQLMEKAYALDPNFMYINPASMGGAQMLYSVNPQAAATAADYFQSLGNQGFQDFSPQSGSQEQWMLNTLAQANRADPYWYYKSQLGTQPVAPVPAGTQAVSGAPTGTAPVAGTMPIAGAASGALPLAGSQYAGAPPVSYTAPATGLNMPPGVTSTGMSYLGGGSGGGDAQYAQAVAQANQVAAQQAAAMQAAQGQQYGIADQYAQRESNLTQYLQGLGDVQRQQVENRRQQLISQAQQDLISRGMTSSTAYDAAMRGIERGSAEDLRALEDQLTQQKMGYLTGLSADTLAARQTAAQGGMGAAESVFQMYQSPIQALQAAADAASQWRNLQYTTKSGLSGEKLQAALGYAQLASGENQAAAARQQEYQSMLQSQYANYANMLNQQILQRQAAMYG